MRRSNTTSVSQSVCGLQRHKNLSVKISEKKMSVDTLKKIWETYTNAWSESDDAKRQVLFENSLLPDCTYCDPMIETSGYKALGEYINELHRNIPGVKFVSTAFSGHHNRSITHWHMMDAANNVLTKGVSYGRYGDDGRLQQMVGFYELSPS
jgi:hypothetical protein